MRAEKEEIGGEERRVVEGRRKQGETQGRIIVTNQQYDSKNSKP